VQCIQHTARIYIYIYLKVQRETVGNSWGNRYVYIYTYTYTHRVFASMYVLQDVSKCRCSLEILYVHKIVNGQCLCVCVPSSKLSQQTHLKFSWTSGESAPKFFRCKHWKNPNPKHETKYL
jgi:hypothetical protein